MAGKDDFEEDAAAGLPDKEDDITKSLREEFDKIEDEEEENDNGGFDTPLDDDAIEKSAAVNEEDGVKILQEARDRDIKPASDEKKPETETAKKEEAPDAKAKTPDATEKAEEKAADSKDDSKGEGDDEGAGKQPAQQLTDEEYSAAIGALPEPVRQKIAAVEQEYNELMAPFKGREAELEGSTPKDAVAYFVKLNDYAKRDPAGYLSWVVQQGAGDDKAKTKAVLEAAAANLGYKIEEADADDDDIDPFETEKERELRLENERLKGGKTQTKTFGPDSPEEVSRQTVMSVINEVDSTGNLVRPHFQKLENMVLAIVKEDAAAGKAMTKESLADAYERAELAHPDTRDEAAEKLLAKKSAAQGHSNVEQKGQNNAAIERSKTASNKIIDGPGQGAGRQPAKDTSDLSLEEFLNQEFDNLGMK